MTTGQITRVYQQHWIELPADVRAHLSKKLGIVRTGISEIHDQQVVSDGFTNEDLKGITIPKLEEYVGSTGEFTKLWAIAVSKANYELHPPMQLKLSERESSENVVNIADEMTHIITSPASASVVAEIINSTDNTHAEIKNKEVSKEQGHSHTSNQGTTSGTDKVSTEGKPLEGSGTSALS